MTDRGSALTDGMIRDAIVRTSLEALIDPTAVGIPTSKDEGPRAFLMKVHSSWADDRTAWPLVTALVPLSQEYRENLRAELESTDRSNVSALRARAGRLDYACFVAVMLYKQLRLVSRRAARKPPG